MGMMDELILRLSRPGDGAAMSEIQVTAIRELGLTHYSQAEVDAWSGREDGRLSPERMEQRLAECFGVVAEVGGAPVAFGLLADGGEVGALYVRPAYARQGIGSAVLGELQSEARRQGLRQVWTTAALCAEDFYASAGFTAQERCRHRFRGGTEIECVRMIRTLDDETPPDA